MDLKDYKCKLRAIYPLGNPFSICSDIAERWQVCAKTDSFRVYSAAHI